MSQFDPQTHVLIGFGATEPHMTQATAARAPKQTQVDSAPLVRWRTLYLGRPHVLTKNQYYCFYM